jgi:hypothetical protein
MSNAIPSRAGIAALAALLMLGAGQALAGLIVVSGDENITNALVGQSVAVNPGNQRFFSNVLGTGTTVRVQGTDVGGVDTPVANLNSFYNSLAGVTATIQAGAVTSASLAGVNLFLSAIPANPFSAAEISALGTFSAGGGTLFLLGDGGSFAPNQDANLNALLAGIGSSLQIVLASIDPGFRTVGGLQIAADPLTTGVNSLTYTFVSQVSGGTTLFTASGGQTFVAVTGEVSAVPEPSTLALFSAILLAFFAGSSRTLRASRKSR